jgi:hypothetical protein
MNLPRENEACQNEPAPFIPTQADQEAATAMFAEWSDQSPVDPAKRGENRRRAQQLIDHKRVAFAALMADIELDEEIQAAAARRRAAKPTDSELSVIASHGTV